MSNPLDGLLGSLREKPNSPDITRIQTALELIAALQAWSFFAEQKNTNAMAKMSEVIQVRASALYRKAS